MHNTRQSLSQKAWISWSSGKDSAFALYELRRDGKSGLDVTALFTTVTQDYDRVSMHATRRILLEKQSEALGIPLHVMEIPRVCTNEVYESRFSEAMQTARAQGVESFVFGDLFLTEIRDYRERVLKPVEIKAEFPLWLRDTRTLAHDMIGLGIEAYITCIDTRKLDPSMVGRRFDDGFLRDLPEDVDPCGENGEFHTFIANAPNFAFRIPLVKGETRSDGDFIFCDFLLGEDSKV